MATFRPGSVGHSITFRDWHVIYQGEGRPDGVARWEAYSPVVGEIIKADTYAGIRSKIVKATGEA